MTYNEAQWRAEVDNGKIPLSKLAEITPRTFDIDLQGPAMMHPEAAAAMSAMIADCPDSLRVIYSYRTYAKQVEKWENYQNGGNLAAVPGTSNHGWAVACDLSGALSWAHDNCKRYGFVFNVPTEDWHIVYEGGFQPEEDDDVNLEKYAEGQETYADRHKKQGNDAGPPPADRDKWFKKGWNAQRAAMNWPKP